MAALSNDSAELLAKKSMQINCCSAKTVRRQMLKVEETIIGLVKQNITWDEDEKERVKELILKRYTNAMQDNIRIDGEQWRFVENQEEDTTDFEPVCVDRRQYLNDEIIPAVDDLQVEVNKNRKHCPHQCAQQLSRQVKYDLSLLQEFGETESKVYSHTDTSDDIHQAHKQNMNESGEVFQVQMKAWPQLVDEGDKIAQARLMRSMMGTTSTDDVLFNRYTDIQNPVSLKKDLKRKVDKDNEEQKTMYSDPETPIVGESWSPTKVKKQEQATASILKKGALLRGDKS